MLSTLIHDPRSKISNNQNPWFQHLASRFGNNQLPDLPPHRHLRMNPRFPPPNRFHDNPVMPPQQSPDQHTEILNAERMPGQPNRNPPIVNKYVTKQAKWMFIKEINRHRSSDEFNFVSA